MPESNGSMMNTPSFMMRSISKRFGGTVALDGVDLAVSAGSVHALVGENGAGKSTLMKVLSGAIQPDAGSMVLNGRPYRPRSPLEARRAGVAMIYQELSLAPHLSVAENIMLGMEPARLGFIRGRESRRRAAATLDRLGHPEISPESPINRLPMAARQIVEIARALTIGCRVLVLDEPTSSLAEKDVARLFDLIATLKADGHAIVYISHFLEEVKQVADRFTVLRDGAVAGYGAMADVTVDALVALMVGREIRQLYPRTPRTPGDALLDVQELAGVARPESASLTLRRGEVLGIAGLVGAGRTELLRALFGLDPVRRGSIRVAAWAGPASPLRRWAQGAGFLSEDRKDEGLAVGLSVADNITLSSMRRFGPLGILLPSRQQAAADDWIVKLGIRCRDGRQTVAELSGGNQQKIALARLLHHDVDLLLLDEPTRGIDVASKAQVYQLIDRLACGSGGQPPKAVLMVSSHLPELLGVCDRIAVMCRGRLGPARPVAEVNEHAIMMEAVG